MISKDKLKDVLIEQRERFLKKPIGVRREALDYVKNKLRLPHVVVITGFRRTGKSTLLRQIANLIYSDRDFYYIDFEDERLIDYDASKFNDIYETLIEVYGKKKVLLIDEIQNIDKFETFVRRLNDSGIKLYITGSNASLLSREYGTRLTGRHINILVSPFSFKEFLLFNNYKPEKSDIYVTEKRAKVKQLFNIYLEKGGMPEYLKFDDEEILFRTYEDTIIKDIAVRYSVNNLKSLRELYRYLVTTFSQKFSYNSLKKITNISSVNTIIKYISYLEETYFIQSINKFDFSLKKQMINDKKIYIIDNGFIPLISLKTTKDKGWLLENLVSNVLSKRNEVFFFDGKKECDFLIREGSKIKEAIQVSYQINEMNKDREIKGLLEAMETYKLKEGLLLTYDQEDTIKINRKTIRIMPVWKWLLT